MYTTWIAGVRVIRSGLDIMSYVYLRRFRGGFVKALVAGDPDGRCETGIMCS